MVSCASGESRPEDPSSRQASQADLARPSLGFSSQALSKPSLSRPSLPPADPQAAARAAFQGAGGDDDDSSDEEGDSSARGPSRLQGTQSMASTASGAPGQPRFKVRAAELVRDLAVSSTG